MMKSKRVYVSFLMVTMLCATLLLGACGAKKDASTGSYPSDSSNQVATEEKAMDTGVTSDMAPEQTGNGSPQSGTEGTSVAENRKLIKRTYLDLETKDFEGIVKNIQDKIKTLNGYIESSNVSGNSYEAQNSYRYGTIVARIPSKNLDQFVTAVKDMGNVINQSDSTEDITLQYVDSKSRVEALTIEQERLLEILKRATKLADIIALEERLAQVRYEIGNYESQLRLYDNLVDYSTVTMNITEVKRITPVQNETMWDRITSGLSDTFYNLKTGMTDFVVWFVVKLPYLLIWAVIIAIVAVVARKALKKYRIHEEKSRLEYQEQLKNRNIPQMNSEKPEPAKEAENKVDTTLENKNEK